MREKVKKRRDFGDIDISKTPYLSYEPYRESPKSTDYKSGEKRSIILRNKATGELEEITYTLCGGVTSSSKSGHISYWGQIEVEDNINCYLTFYYDLYGGLEKISASFAGRSPNKEEFEEMTRGIRYAAEFTTRGAF